MDTGCQVLCLATSTGCMPQGHHGCEMSRQFVCLLCRPSFCSVVGALLFLSSLFLFLSLFLRGPAGAGVFSLCCSSSFPCKAASPSRLRLSCFFLFLLPPVPPRRGRLPCFPLLFLRHSFCLFFLSLSLSLSSQPPSAQFACM